LKREGVQGEGGTSFKKFLPPPAKKHTLPTKLLDFGVGVWYTIVRMKAKREKHDPRNYF
jgi:hypothetical protein